MTPTPSPEDLQAARQRRHAAWSNLRGPLAWMAQNSVAANLLMAVIIFGGLFMATQIKQEVFPEFDLDLISVAVPYPGASPEEVEQGIVLAIEEAVRGLEGIKQVSAQALEGAGVVTLELLEGENVDRARSEVQTAIDRIRSFPVDAERPIVSILTIRNKVISLVLYGPFDEEARRQLAERARDELLADPRVTQVDLVGVRPREIAIEVPPAHLRAHGFTLSGISEAVRRASVELPAGSLKTPGGETLVRIDERRDLGKQFAALTLWRDARGRQIRVGDVAEVHDGFEDLDLITTFNGQPAVQLDVYRVGDQTPITVAAAVREYAEALKEQLPEGIKVATWNDRSEIYADRIDLLRRNAIIGLVLVLVSLGLFLEIGLAFWVTLGIPISFLGAFLLMPGLDVSLNMVSLFAFIITLGIVVDDAIVVGENIYEQRQRGVPPMEAAISGVRQVAVPVTFAVLTTVAAFSPLLFISGATGKFFSVIPLIVIAVILFSLVESLLILPAHLAHAAPPRRTGLRGLFNRQQARVARGLQWIIRRSYIPSVRFATRYRYLTLSAALAVLLISFGYIRGGHLGFSFLPRVEGDVVAVNAQLPVGAPLSESVALRDRLLRTAREAVAAHGGDAIVRGTYAQVGEAMGGGGPMSASGPARGGHLVSVAMHLVPADQREISSQGLVNAWRSRNPGLVGVDKIAFTASLRTAGGSPIDVALSHREIDVLETAARELAAALPSYGGVSDVNDGVAGGKRQIDLRLRPAASALGLTETELARQVRDAFFGAEAIRQQRGRDEVRVMVRLPATARASLATLESLIVRTPGGGEIPLAEAAFLSEGSSYTAITRENGRRVIRVTADVDEAIGNAERILNRVRAELMGTLEADHPGLSYWFEGARRDRVEMVESLKMGFPLALFVIFGLLAVPFRSYTQPLIIMAAIPFGMIGAVLGHLLLGYELSLMSVFGLVALTGIVVNDSLILVVAINELRDDGTPLHEAVVAGGARRFRPILLTSLTTFLGLVPMIFEPSVQARFLIPMAISLGFGVLLATAVILVLTPALYLVLEDLKAAWDSLREPTAPPDPDGRPEPGAAHL